MEGFENEKLKELSEKSYLQETSDEAEMNKIKFNADYFGGEREADALIERFKKDTTISEERMQRIRENVPDAADFRILTREEYNNKWRINQKKYDKKVRKYLGYRKKFFQTKDNESKGKKKKDGIAFAHAIKQSEKKIAYMEQLREYEKRGILRELPEDPQAMDDYYNKTTKSEEFKEAQSLVSKYQAADLRPQMFSYYTNTTMGAYKINQELRSNGEEEINSVGLVMKKEMKKSHMVYDNVVRRGVNDVKTVASMLGIKHYDSLTNEQVKQELKKRIDSGEDVIFRDYGFVSTSQGYAADKYSAGNSEKIGVEFVILAKKGTEAFNISGTSAYESEGEVLLNAGTKFKLIRADIDGDAKIEVGNEKSWRIYLVTIPQNEDGILKGGKA
ncbi:MAG: ADP-ribosyltransferase [Lachnospiraceae bacterium]|nr:ADP-ribosyltransferase [Lachnospiraceae bacterium]